MWVAKFKNWHKTCLIRPLCVKYQVTDLVHMLNYWEEGENFFYTELHQLQGDEENIKKFIKGMKYDKATIKIIIQGNYVVTLNKIPKIKEYKHVFNPEIIYVKPTIQRTDGYEDWEIASWKKEELMKIMKIPVFEMKLVYVKKLDFSEIFFPQILPKLPKKQKQAIHLAIQEGYYNTPRKITLEKLSKLTKVKKQTFQEHLTKAENKMIPFLTENKY